MATKNFLGEFEQMVLLAVIRIGDEAYGVRILDEIERRTSRVVSRGALYITLDRLEAKGYLTSKLGEPTPARGGRAKRYVTVTAAGKKALREVRTAMLNLWDGIEGAL